VTDDRDAGALLEVLLEATRLKELDRTGWVRVGVPRPESVASHSWGVAWLVMVLLPDELDRERALSYAVLHDLAEVRVGDLTPHDGVAPEEKARREQAAMAELAAAVGRPSLLTTWEAYEAQADAESRFVRQLDRLDMALQALVHHERGHGGMAEFVASASKVIDHPRLTDPLAEIKRRLGSKRP
jgi:putative hydrolase of HD superfamily